MNVAVSGKASTVPPIAASKGIGMNGRGIIRF